MSMSIISAEDGTSVDGTSMSTISAEDGTSVDGTSMSTISAEDGTSVDGTSMGTISCNNASMSVSCNNTSMFGDGVSLANLGSTMVRGVADDVVDGLLVDVFNFVVGDRDHHFDGHVHVMVNGAWDVHNNLIMFVNRFRHVHFNGHGHMHLVGIGHEHFVCSWDVHFDGYVVGCGDRNLDGHGHGHRDSHFIRDLKLFDAMNGNRDSNQNFDRDGFGDEYGLKALDSLESLVRLGHDLDNLEWHGHGYRLDHFVGARHNLRHFNGHWDLDHNFEGDFHGYGHSLLNGNVVLHGLGHG